MNKILSDVNLLVEQIMNSPSKEWKNILERYPYDSIWDDIFDIGDALNNDKNDKDKNQCQIVKEF